MRFRFSREWLDALILEVKRAGDSRLVWGDHDAGCRPRGVEGSQRPSARDGRIKEPRRAAEHRQRKSHDGCLLRPGRRSQEPSA
jgi:hypothetical protein